MARFMKDGLGRLSAALIAMLAILGLNAAAFAVEPGVPGNPDLAKTGSITVHKYKTPAEGNLGAANGKEITGAPDKGKLSGVEFSVQKIDNLDLSVSSNWDKVAKLEYKDGKVKLKSGNDPFDLGTATIKETDKDGVATFSDLKAGVYLVKEGADNGNNNITSKAAPFFVTIPMPDTTEKTKPGWIYDVHVYPKNAVTTVKKTLDDSEAYKKDDVVKWTVTAEIPKLGKDEKHTRLEVSDTFDERLQFVEVSSVKIGETELDKADYTIVGKAKDKTVKVKINNPETYLAGKEGQTFAVVFNTKVVKTGDGVIPNKATVFINNPGKDQGVTPENEPGIPTDEPETKWGWIQITKLDQDNEKKLAGAEFTVYLTKEDANKGENAITTFPSDGDGIAKVMLKAGENGTTYFVKETKAPAGYVLSDEIHEMKVTAGATAAETAMKDVNNAKQEVPELPITGAAGTLLLTIGGSAVLLAALGTAFVAMRRRARA